MYSFVSEKCCMLIITSLHVIHQSLVLENSACYSSVISSRKFCMLMFTNSAYQFQKSFANYKDKKTSPKTSTVSIETVLVSACIFHVSALKPAATNQLQVCYSRTLQGPRKSVLPLTVSVETVLESAHY